MLSWRRSRGPDSAACCDGLEVRRCGNDQHGCDVADLKMGSCWRTKKIQLNSHDLSHKHAFTFVHACEQTVCTSCTLCECLFCVHSPSNCRYCVPAIRNPTVQHALTDFFLSFTAHHIGWNVTTMTSLPSGILPLCKRRTRSMRQHHR